MNQKIIIIDGPEKVGKTTISRELSKRINIPYFKRSISGFTEKSLFLDKFSFKEATKYDQTYIIDFLKQTNYSIIFDRCYPSEWVYSKVFGRERDEKILSLIDQEYSLLNTYILIFLRKIYKYNDDIIKIEKLPLIHKEYINFSQWTKCNTKIMYNDSEDLKFELDEILKFVGGENEKLSYII